MATEPQDIVTRLRFWSGDNPLDPERKVRLAAADEIQRLRAELAEAQRELGKRVLAEAEAEKLRGQLGLANSQHDKAVALAERTNDARLKAEAALAEARTALEAVRQDAAKLRGLLEVVEWIDGHDENWYCPWCFGRQFKQDADPGGHKPNCLRQLALAGGHREDA